MTIVDLRLTGLSGGTVEGGWAKELTPEDDVHTIVEVITDTAHVGIGSTFTSSALVAAAVKLLKPFLIGERADEPARVSEKLRQRPLGALDLDRPPWHVEAVTSAIA